MNDQEDITFRAVLEGPRLLVFENYLERDDGKGAHAQRLLAVEDPNGQTSQVFAGRHLYECVLAAQQCLTVDSVRFASWRRGVPLKNAPTEGDARYAERPSGAGRIAGASHCCQEGLPEHAIHCGH
ncbi:hypothetical protein [Variovorax sp. WDL1]|uniref:hypothetical protein n=1 Tax=Variovorax sp. WDL1 TaxID=207745 RepID=UPI0012ED7B5F|nr:hypothetical protein [Variovorax sp. WDL1]